MVGSLVELITSNIVLKCNRNTEQQAH